jgi:hypothetical protein
MKEKNLPVNNGNCIAEIIMGLLNLIDMNRRKIEGTHLLCKKSILK